MPSFITRARRANRRSRTLRCKRHGRRLYQPFQCAVDVPLPGSPAQLGPVAWRGLMRKPMAAAYPAARSVAGAPGELPWSRIGATVRRAGQPGQHPAVVGLLAHHRPWFPAACRLTISIVIITGSFLLDIPLGAGRPYSPHRGGVDRERHRPDAAQRATGGLARRRARGRDRTQPGPAVCPGHAVARPDHRKRPTHRCRRSRSEHRLLSPLTPTDARISAAQERPGTHDRTLSQRARGPESPQCG